MSCGNYSEVHCPFDYVSCKEKMISHLILYFKMITNSPSLYLILNLLQNPHKINWLFKKKKNFRVRKSSQKSTANHAPRKRTVFRRGNEVELSSPSNPLGEKMTLARTCHQIVHVFQPCPEDTETWTGLPTTAGWAVTGRLASLYFLGKHEGKHLAFLVWSWFVSLKCLFFFRKENCIEITSKTKDPHCLVGSKGIPVYTACRQGEAVFSQNSESI